MHAFCICLFPFCSFIVDGRFFSRVCVFACAVRTFINCQITNATLELSQSINFKFHAVLSGQSAHFARVIIDFVVSMPIVYVWSPATREIVFYSIEKLYADMLQHWKQKGERAAKKMGLEWMQEDAHICAPTDRFHSWKFPFFALRTQMHTFTCDTSNLSDDNIQIDFFSVHWNLNSKTSPFPCPCFHSRSGVLRSVDLSLYAYAHSARD